MVQRIAVCLALLSFAVCLFVGGVQAENTFATTVWRALVAMGVTFAIGLAVGGVAKVMLEENIKATEEKLKKDSVKT